MGARNAMGTSSLSDENLQPRVLVGLV